jgi:hypothetical protein
MGEWRQPFSTNIAKVGASSSRSTIQVLNPMSRSLAPSASNRLRTGLHGQACHRTRQREGLLMNHYRVLPPYAGRPARIRTAHSEVEIRPDELGDLIDDLKALDAEINPGPAFARDVAMRDDTLTGGG